MTAEVQRARVRPGDVLVGGALLLLGVVGTGPAADNQPAAVAPDGIAYALVAAVALSLVAWRWRPVHVCLFAGAVIAVYLALGYPFGPILLAGAFAAGGLAAQRPWRAAAAVVAVDMLVVGAAVVVRGSVVDRAVSMSPLGVLLWALVWVGLPGAIGVAVRIRREAAVRVRSEQARRAVSEERLRMAQEVHDVVGHGLAVIAMQAGAGLHVLDRDPAKARESLEAIRATSREALDGLRAELAALRGEAVPGADGGASDAVRGEAPRRPGVGIADLPTLVERVRSGGLDVRIDLEQPERPPPAGVGLAAYRIVQEALTNVLRHAGTGATARVHVRQARGRLLVEVTDTGHGPPSGGLVDGSGIAGMRSRTAGVGGTLEVGARPGGGVQVRAWLPLEPEEVP
jgi:signal transduction histidine kinase